MFITANADYSFSVLLLEASVFLFFFFYKEINLIGKRKETEPTTLKE
jgi:hypothetical protein